MSGDLGSDETIFPTRRKRPETDGEILMICRIKGDDYADIHSQFDLPRVSEERRSWHGEPGGTTTMTEIVTALLAFFSFSVFLAHAYDAYRGGRWTEL
jgi:hypothetical protein